MATLQKLRNAGPLLLIFVGLALLAFVAGDALRIFQSPQGSQSVGSINGEEVTAVEYQKMYEEYANAYKLLRRGASLSDMEMNRLKDEVWNSYVRYSIIKKEADKIGLTVTDEEIKAIAEKGEHPIFRQFPIFNDEQGKFDIDVLNNFLVGYDQNKDNAEYIQSVKPFYDCWCLMEKEIRNSALIEKYSSLLGTSFISNPTVAENIYNANNSTYDIVVKAYPYSAIADSTVNVGKSDIKSVYEQEKERYKQYDERREIKYVSYHVTPSVEDRAALRNELAGYADSLKAGNEDYATIARLSNSEVPYSTIAWAKDVYPEEVQLRIDSLKANEVAGPIYNQSDDSYTVFKVIGKTTVPDSVMYRSLAVNAQTAERAGEIADSLIAVLKSGADFKEISKTYGQTNNDSTWLTSAMYEGAPIAGDDQAFVSTLLNSKKGEYNYISLSNAPTKIIYQVIATKNPETKYNALVIRRTSEFSSDTYNEAYNAFSQFVASCKTVEDLEKNAEEYGYRVMADSRLYNYSYGVANIADTRDAIRWLFNEAKLNEVSPLYECGAGDNLLVMALTKVNEKGYTPMEDLTELLNKKAANNKKAEKIIAEISGKSFDELANVANIKSDSVKRVSFGATANIPVTSAREPVISAVVTKMQVGEVSEPIKGQNGVYVIKLTSKSTKAGEFNAESEQARLKAQAQAGTSRFLTDLYEKANVTDNRYLYF